MNGAGFMIPVVAACLALSFLLSGMEAGVFALSRLRIRNLMRQGRKTAHQLNSYLQDPETFLWTIVAGNTLSNLVVFGALVLWLHSILAGRPLLLVAVFIVAVLLFYALFDLLPKMLFRKFPNRLCLALVRPFRLIHFALKPLVVTLEAFSDAMLAITRGAEFKRHLFGTRDELRIVMQESAQHLSSEERAMIDRVLDMQGLTVQQVARPIHETVSLSRSHTMRDALAVARDRGLTRMLVREGTQADARVMGVLSLRRLLYDENLNLEKPVGDYVTPALYITGETRVETALRRMQN